MNDDMPERIFAGYGMLGGSQQWFEVERVHFGRTTEYIRADVAQAQLGAANARIAELEAAQQWVSVDERLPEVGASVATISRTGIYGTVPSVSNSGAWFYNVFAHWMPLPPPPVTDVTP